MIKNNSKFFKSLYIDKKRKQTTKKNIAKGMVISGLLTIVLSTGSLFINRNEIESLSSQRKRLLEYNNQIYSIALQNPSTYNQNITRINDLEARVKALELK